MPPLGTAYPLVRQDDPSVPASPDDASQPEVTLSVPDTMLALVSWASLGPVAIATAEALCDEAYQRIVGAESPLIVWRPRAIWDMGMPVGLLEEGSPWELVRDLEARGLGFGGIGSPESEGIFFPLFSSV